MVEGGSGKSFALEPLQRLSIVSHVRGEKRQGHVPVQPQLLGLVHHTHAAAAQHAQHAILRNRLSDQHYGFVPRRRITP